MINFDVEPEFQEQIDWVEKFAKEEIEPLDNFFPIGKTKDGNPVTKEGWAAIRKHIESRCFKTTAKSVYWEISTY